MLLAAIGASSGGPGADDYVSLIFRAVLAMAFIALLIGGVAILRKRLRSNEDDEHTGTLSMGGLRELVRQGKMTQAEFDQAKAAVVEATQKQIARDAARKAEALRMAGETGRKRQAGGQITDVSAFDDDVPPSPAN